MIRDTRNFDRDISSKQVRPTFQYLNNRRHGQNPRSSLRSISLKVRPLHRGGGCMPPPLPLFYSWLKFRWRHLHLFFSSTSSFMELGEGSHGKMDTQVHVKIALCKMRWRTFFYRKWATTLQVRQDVAKKVRSKENISNRRQSKRAVALKFTAKGFWVKCEPL